MGNRFTRSSEASSEDDVILVTRDGVLRDLIRLTHKKDLQWGKSLSEVERSLIQNVEVAAQEKMNSVLTKVPGKFCGITPDELRKNGSFQETHTIAINVMAQIKSGKYIGRFELPKSDGFLVVLPDKTRKCAKLGEPKDKALYVELLGWASSTDVEGFDKKNASSAGPNLWFVLPGNLMHIFQLSADQRCLLKEDIDNIMDELTTLIINYMANVCSSESSASAFRANGLSDEEIQLFVQHMKVPGAMDLLLTMQASNLEGQANTSVPIPHMQTNLGFTDAYLAEHSDLAIVVSRMMKIFQEQMTCYIGQYVTPF